MTASHTRVMLVALTIAANGCKSSEPPAPSEEPGAFTDPASLTPAERRQLDEFLVIIDQYYPKRDPARETEEAYYLRYRESPEIQRLHARVRAQEHSDAWGACVDDLRRTLGPTLRVRDGTPPGFSIPSYQVVISGDHPDGRVTMVFRVSMLAPVFDYYEHIRAPSGVGLALRLTPSEETARAASAAAHVIHRHFPTYRQLPTDIGAVRVPNISVGNSMLDNASVADALLEAVRPW